MIQLDSRVIVIPLKSRLMASPFVSFAAPIHLYGSSSKTTTLALADKSVRQFDNNPAGHCLAHIFREQPRQIARSILLQNLTEWVIQQLEIGIANQRQEHADADDYYVPHYKGAQHLPRLNILRCDMQKGSTGSDLFE